MRLLSFLIIFIHFFIIFSCTLLAGEPIILKYADELIGANSDSLNMRTLIGNVQLQQNNVYVTCDNAVQYMNLNKFRLTGNVVITQNTVILKAPLVTYNGNSYLADADNGVSIKDKNTLLTAKRGNFSTQTQIANFYDDVVLQDDSVTIYCDFITHQRKNGDSKAAKNVLIKSKNSNTFLLADTIINIAEDNYSFAVGNPVLFQIDTTRTFIFNHETDIEEEIIKLDTLTVKSDTMEAFRDKTDEYYRFKGNVEIVRNDLRASANDGYFYKHREYFILRETPIVWHNSTQLHADSINVFMRKNKLNKLESVGNAIAITTNDTINLDKIDQLAGDKIDIFFESDTLKSIESHGNAKSLYFMKTDNEPDGIIKNSAEAILIGITDGEIEKITLIEQIPGEYMPEPLVAGNEKKLFLQEYKSADNQPNRPDINLNLYFRNIK